MARPDFDASASDTNEAGDVGTSIENAYFGAYDSNIGSLQHAEDTSVGYVFGTRTENADGTS